MTSQIVYLRLADCGSDILELTSQDDPDAVPYVVASTALKLNITEKRNLFYYSGDYDPDFRAPCNECRHKNSDEDGWPCAGCDR